MKWCGTKDAWEEGARDILEKMLGRVRPKLVTRVQWIWTHAGEGEEVPEAGEHGQHRGGTKHSDTALLGQINTSRWRSWGWGDSQRAEGWDTSTTGPEDQGRLALREDGVKLMNDTEPKQPPRFQNSGHTGFRHYKLIRFTAPWHAGY